LWCPRGAGIIVAVAGEEQPEPGTMDYVLKFGDEFVEAARHTPAPTGPPLPDPDPVQTPEARKIGKLVDQADALEARPYGCMMGILIALIAFAATLGITVAVAALVGGESGPLDTLPKGKPAATTTAVLPSTTRIPVTTSTPAPTSTTLPVGGVQPPTEIIPGVIELPPDPDVPPSSAPHDSPPSEHQQNPCVSGHEPGC
jgi:hypothetical protein